MDTQKQVCLNNVHLKILLRKLAADESKLIQKVENLKEENYKLKQQVIDREARIREEIRKDVEEYYSEIRRLENSKPFMIKEEIEGKIRGLEKTIQERKRNRNHLVIWSAYLAAFVVGVSSVILNS